MLRLYKSVTRLRVRHHFRSKLVVINTALRRMITSCPLVLVLAVASSFAWKLTPLDIDDFPCKPENLKAQNRYICNSEGKVSCLPGWKEKPYSPNPHFPCALPICDPPCLRGECRQPNVCSCEIGWDGVDCGICIKMPGCQHGDCNEVDGKDQPLTCNCQDGWKGALCDIPKCDSDDDGNECSNHGICVDQGSDDHVCRCNTGWKGVLCDGCAPVDGCDTTHTVNATGCINKNGEPVPNSCQCQPGWKGPLCDTAQCLDSKDNPIECANGECKDGGMKSEGTILAAFCQCQVGWTGEKCDQCIPAPNCSNDNKEPGELQACVQPNECRCQGDPENPNLNEQTKYCTKWIPSDTCGVDADCPDNKVCDDNERCVAPPPSPL